MKDKFKILLDKGFFHIFGSSVINKIFQFAGSIFIVRLLSKEQYGLYSYANNILMLFLLFNGLGVTAGMLQYGSETIEEENRDSFFKYGIKVGIYFNLIISVLILLYSNALPIKNAVPILISMFLLPAFMFLFETLQIYCRASLENRKFSFLSTLNTSVIIVYSIIGAYYYEIIGLVVSLYFAYITSIIVGIYLLRKKLPGIIKSSKLVGNIKKEFIKFSLISSFGNAISQLLYIIDIFLIGLILGNESILASYKIATIIPFALKFIPASIMMFVYPYYAKNNNNKKWVRENYIKLTKYLIIFNIVLTLFLMIFAEIIINMLFGIQYKDSIIAFRILSLGYFVAGTFRIPAGNVLVMLKEVKFGMYLSAITGVFNVMLDIVLIKYYGSTGAAIATLSVFIFTSIIGVSYLMYILNSDNLEKA